jgi:predicted nucleic acid-binding protein
MRLADTSIWVAHFREPNPEMARALDAEEILSHPAVRGELALGGLPNRELVLRRMRRLDQAFPASDEEVIAFISARRLMGRGIGWVDAHLLASLALTPGATLWTSDRRLAAIAVEQGVG